MPRLAMIGSSSSSYPSSNVCEWLFAMHYSPGGEFLRQSPELFKNHNIPKFPQDIPLLVDPATNAILTWSRARDDALRFAAGLQNLGLQPAAVVPTVSAQARRIRPIVSPVVMVHLPNCVQYASILFGIFASGLTATLVNPALTANDLMWLLQSSNPAVIVTSAATLKIVEDAIALVEDDEMKRVLAQCRLYVVDPAMEDYSTSFTRFASASGAEDWKCLLISSPLETPVPFSPAECRSRTAVILWSSGTTGRSKGVPLSHNAMTTTITSTLSHFRSISGQERFLGVAPFYHIFGLAVMFLLAPTIGSTIYVMPKFDFLRMMSYVTKYKLTILHIAAPIAVLLAKDPAVTGADFSSVRMALSGGSAVPPEIADLVYKRLGFMIKLGYGLSETGSVAFQDADTYNDLQFQHGSTGIPLWGNEIKIVSPDNSKVLMIDEEGEVLIRSPSLLNCYLNDEKATAESLDNDGWFHTGDIAKIDDRGFLYITDRVKEMIKVKGFQVSPSELEAIICKSNRVADAAVGPIYDEATATELPRAYIVPAEPALFAACASTSKGSKIIDAGLQDLGKHVKALVEEKSTHYKWLRGNIVFVQQVPKSPAGKILRRFLKDVNGVEVEIYAKPRMEPSRGGSAKL